MRPHVGYYPMLKKHFETPGLHGMAHITGGGILDNLRRILPADTDAIVDLSQLSIPTVFAAIRDAGAVDDAEMLRTYNMGIGLICICSASAGSELAEAFTAAGLHPRFLGEIQAGSGQARAVEMMPW
jgi:phosphoribosylformylglycinamidine cyclo-ligase